MKEAARAEERGTGHWYVEVREGLWEFPLLDILCPLTGGGEKGAPALTEQKWDLQCTFIAISRLVHVPLRGTFPLPHPECAMRLPSGPHDGESALFFSTRIADAGKGQGGIDRWRKESGYEYGMFLV